MDEKQDLRNPSGSDRKQNDSETPEGISRRAFLGAAGLAASAALLGSASDMSAQAGGPYWYLNSFGEVVPVSQDVIDMGLYPPPLPAGTETPSQATPGGGRSREMLRRPTHGAGHRPMDLIVDLGATQYNVLLIMVDQLRRPRWVPPPPSGQTLADSWNTILSLTPNIRNLETQSFSFTNFFVAATACTPSRATLLTGLYTQQTCQFKTQANSDCQPDLNPNFPNIASVLNQISPSVPSFWVGKWHLSDPSLPSGGAGANGPTDYGFYVDTSGTRRNLPSDQILSPNGGGNAGSEAYNPAGPAYHPTNGALPATAHPFPSSYALYNDAAICDFFLETTAPVLNSLATQTTPTPWFAALSLINPHDITQFPYSYNRSGDANFSVPQNPPYYSFYPPLVNGSPGNAIFGTDNKLYADTYLPALNSIYSTVYNASIPASWNYNDTPAGGYNGGSGKPDFQLAFQTNIANAYGTGDGSVVSWNTFLNYYFWMQTCVDFQIGRVLKRVPPMVLANTVIVFTSDHGEYGGAHGLHAKGGAIYDEALNVPLYISYPGMRPPVISNPGSGPYYIPFVCSMVDILPFVYATGQGNDDYTWRHTSADPVYYLRGRESLLDAIYGYYLGGGPTWARQRRLSTIPNLNNGTSTYNNQTLQPYILTTTDEDQTQGETIPTHIVGFRTVDLTVQYQNADGINVYGGGKLGIYSIWPPVPTPPNSSNIGPALTQPAPANAQQQQFEFYDYTGSQNYAEKGNEWLTNPANSAFLAAFNNTVVQNELYVPGAFTAGPYNTQYQAAMLNWALAVTNSGCS